MLNSARTLTNRRSLSVEPRHGHRSVCEGRGLGSGSSRSGKKPSCTDVEDLLPPARYRFRVSDTQSAEEIATVTRGCAKRYSPASGPICASAVLPSRTKAGRQRHLQRQLPLSSSSRHTCPVLIAKDPAAFSAALVHCGSYRPFSCMQRPVKTIKHCVRSQGSTGARWSSGPQPLTGLSVR